MTFADISQVGQKKSSGNCLCLMSVGVWNGSKALSPELLTLKLPPRASYQRSCSLRLRFPKRGYRPGLQVENLMVQPFIRRGPASRGINEATCVCKDCAGRMKVDDAISIAAPSVLFMRRNFRSLTIGIWS